ncbi:hypothetical protein ACKFR8_09925 [Corynebacterium axilliensis]|uniref:hypothetical protein n=1 Tax=Corynebacterium sp. YSMAA5_1_F9 TaxID=3383591 RepID=UPI0038CF54EA
MTDSTHHVVVLDCNIILTLASHFDGSFTPSEVKALVARSAVRATSQPILNAARAFMLATRGETFTGQPISFVTSRHILNTVIHKATQPSQGPTQEQQGLGLHRRVAEDLSDFFENLSMDSFGSVIEPHQQVAENTPPLDHEDGMVYGLCRFLSGMDSRFHVWCVTSDRDFIAHAKTFERANFIRVVAPGEFVNHHQRLLVAAMRSGGSAPDVRSQR